MSEMAIVGWVWWVFLWALLAGSALSAVLLLVHAVKELRR